MFQKGINLKSSLYIKHLVANNIQMAAKSGKNKHLPTGQLDNHTLIRQIPQQ